MPINDYQCNVKSCRYIDKDRLYKSDKCPNCDGEGTFEVFFGDWKKLEFNPYSANDRHDSKGFIRKFSSLDDPLCQANMGMGSKQLQSYNKMTEEESKSFRERLIKDGDSPKLRREILAKYNEKVGNKYELQD